MLCLSIVPSLSIGKVCAKYFTRSMLLSLKEAWVSAPHPGNAQYPRLAQGGVGPEVVADGLRTWVSPTPRKSCPYRLDFRKDKPVSGVGGTPGLCGGFHKAGHYLSVSSVANR